ncbi:hypothetical protein SCHPADRAFT_944605 [Schizopora paradoxa]|uniref:Uncharacterized protein n=1 Tax=Schizopora paradoxa TaxID=27342 RepID=A0A0H2R8R7_9AGAM|nr:hypothetical protein SCHPADRAFT_944605 [Schizopora paradoxa]
MGSNLPSTSPDRQSTYNDTPGDEDANVVMPLSSSVPDEHREDDTIDTTTVYSYYSTWSTNYTMSNLPGPGRILGNFYSRAGRALEKHLGRIVDRTSIIQAKVVMYSISGTFGLFVSKNPKKHETGCEVLLACARSDEIRTQLDAFVEIVFYFAERTSEVHSAFNRVFERRNQISDVITFSWKRPGVEYSTEWLFWYKLASRCLSSHQSPVFEATAQFNGVQRQSLDFSHFEGLLLSCDAMADFILAVSCICNYWNIEGIEHYISSKGFRGPALVQFATGLLAWWDAHFFQPDPHWSWLRSTCVLFLTRKLFDGMTRSSRNVDTDGTSGHPGYDALALLAMWEDVHKLHHILRRYFVSQLPHFL